MALNSTHPTYAAMLADWQLMRDSYMGERAVKARGVTYLPATPGQMLDGMTKATEAGYIAYEAYKLRAVFPDYVSEAVERYIGLLHQKEATIELPPQLEDMREKATVDGESLMALLRRINEQQLVTGRLGLMLDFPQNPDPSKPLPYIAMYFGEAIRNWDESADGRGVNGLVLVVLDESGPVRQPDFEWTQEERYRVLMLGPETPAQTDGNTEAPDDPTEGVGLKQYRQQVYAIKDAPNGVNFDTMAIPQFRGKTLDELPFVFVNSKDIIAEPDNPPLLGLGRLCMTIYRGEADYRFSLFLQGQQTLVTIGTVYQDGEVKSGDDVLRVGAGARIGMDTNGDAKYIGIGADGLAPQSEALTADRKMAEAQAGTMIAPTAGRQESGDALTARVAAQTASLTQIAKAGALALENLLKIAAKWVGADPEKVKVTPNLEFAPVLVTGQEATQLMSARAMGLPLSLESIHGVLADRGLTQFDYDTEMDKIAEEDAGRVSRFTSMGLGADGKPIPAPAPEPGQEGTQQGTQQPPGGPQGAR